MTGYSCCFNAVILFSFDLKEVFWDSKFLMLAILNKAVTNLGTRRQAHTTVCADLGLFLLCLTKVKGGFDYFRPWVGEDLCYSVQEARGRLAKGVGQQHSLVPDQFIMSQSPFQGLPPTQAALDEVPRCLKNQVGKIKPGLKGFCSHFLNLRKFWPNHLKAEKLHKQTSEPHSTALRIRASLVPKTL